MRFWENRVSSQSLEYPPSAAQPALTDNVAVRNIRGQGHPVGSVRVDRLKDELLRWETERRAALLKARLQPQESAVVHYATGSGYAVGNVWYAPSQGGSLFTAETQVCWLTMKL